MPRKSVAKNNNANTKKVKADEKSVPHNVHAQEEATSSVLAACAAMSPYITVVGWNPPRVVPESAVEMTLSEIGIKELEDFRDLLKTLLPEEMDAAVDSIKLDLGMSISDVMRAVAERS